MRKEREIKITHRKRFGMTIGGEYIVNIYTLFKDLYSLLNTTM